jgi:hypothetical protein
MNAEDIKVGHSYKHWSSDTLATVTRIRREYWLFGPKVVYMNLSSGFPWYMSMDSFLGTVDEEVTGRTK